jgi:iron complex outermembrane receptor protein
MWNSRQLPILIAWTLIVTVTPPALANSKAEEQKREEAEESLLTSVSLLSPLSESIANPSSPIAQGVSVVTGIRLNPTDRGLEVILETPSDTDPRTFKTRFGETLVIDLINTQLQLPEGNRFLQENPTAGIASVEVVQQYTNTVRVRIVGTQEVPSAEVVNMEQGLALNVMTETAMVEEPPLPPATEPIPSDPIAEEDEDEDIETIELIVTATRTAEEEEDIPRAVTVITREEIEQQTAITRDLVDIIGKTSPGLGPPTQTDSNFGQSIRGRAPQVLIDGVPITSNDSNDSFSRDLRSIAPEAVERIEIVRGPSAVFGNGATGGVINIITRRPSDQQLTLQTEVGVNAALGELEGDSFGNFISQSISGREGNFDYLALFSRNDTGIFYDAEGDPIPFEDEGTSETETINVLGKVGVNFGEDQRLQLTANHTRDDYNFSLITDPSIDDLPFRRKARAIDVGEQEYIGVSDPGTVNTAVTLDYSHEDLFGSQLNAQAYYRSTDIFPAAFDGREFGFGVSRIDWLNDVFGGRLQIETPLSEVASLLWGTDYSNEENFGPEILFDPQEFDASGGRTLRATGEELIFFPRHTIKNLGLFAQADWEVSEQWRLSGGLRYERFSVSIPDFTNSINEEIEGGDVNFDDVVFNAGVVFQTTPELSLYGSFAQGFSAPPISRILFNASQGFNFGRDVDISSPQKVDNYEIGVRGEWETVQFSLAAFFNESELGATLIRENPDDLNLTLVRSPQRNYGVEGTVDWQPIEDWQLGGTFTWFVGEADFPNDDEGFLGLRSPESSPIKLTAYVENQTTPGWRNRLQALFVGSRDRGFEDGVDPVEIDNYFVLDFISSVELGPGELQLGIENLLDNQFATVVQQWEGGFSNSGNIPARGRTISLNYRFTW